MTPPHINTEYLVLLYTPRAPSPLFQKGIDKTFFILIPPLPHPDSSDRLFLWEDVNLIFSPQIFVIWNWDQSHFSLLIMDRNKVIHFFILDLRLPLVFVPGLILRSGKIKDNRPTN